MAGTPRLSDLIFDGVARPTGLPAASATGHAVRWDEFNTAKVVGLPLILYNGGAVISTGFKGFIPIPYGATIEEWTLLGDVSGSIVIDIWKDTYANYPPVVGDSITASAKPTVSSAVKAQSSSLTGWTTSITAGDVLGINVDSITAFTLLTLSLKIRRT